MEQKKEVACVNCGSRVEKAQNGRPKKYCSKKCASKVQNQKKASKAKQPAGSVRCVYCGNIFERSGNSARQCCSRKCAHRFNRQEKIEQIRKPANDAKKENKQRRFRDFVLETYFNGCGRMAIADALGLTENTIESWTRYYEKKDNETWQRKKIPKGISAYKQYSYPGISTNIILKDKAK